MHNEDNENAIDKYERSWTILNYYKHASVVIDNPENGVDYNNFKGTIPDFNFSRDEFERIVKLLIGHSLLQDYNINGYKITRDGRSILLSHPSPRHFSKYMHIKDFVDYINYHFASAELICEELNIPKWISSETIVNDILPMGLFEVKAEEFGSPNYQIRLKQNISIPVVDYSTNITIQGDAPQSQFAIGSNHVEQSIIKDSSEKKNFWKTILGKSILMVGLTAISSWIAYKFGWV